MDFDKHLELDPFLRYRPDMFSAWLDAHLKGVRLLKDTKKCLYINAPCSFDIETSSFTEGGEKRATMYIWAFGFNGGALYGRTWEEFLQLTRQLSELLQLSSEKKVICYVHNLAYEFQWFRKYFKWESVFSVKERKPVKALTDLGIEFRCSFLLSGYKLETVGNNLKTYHVKKLVGALDYSQSRHSETYLEPRELEYLQNDVLVVMAYIKERIEEAGGSIARVPLTNTGYVRNFCRAACLYEPGTHHKTGKKYRKYKALMNQLTLTPEQYTMCKAAFMGGFTHANAFYSGAVVENVGSIDFTSSYPAVMCAKMYPMSSPEYITIESEEQLQELSRYYALMFDVEIAGLYSKVFYDHPLNRSKCYGVKGCTEDNGRIVKAELLYTTITEQDYKVLKAFYGWETLRVGRCVRWRRAYLPRDFIASILELYRAKTELKDVEGSEVEYMRKKGMLNSCYGMSVTDIAKPDLIYTDDWHDPEPVDLEKVINAYNKKKNRFLYYPWGIYVTAYARAALFSGILAFGNDYIYSDTDSIKGRNMAAHQDYINAYNEQITAELLKMCEVHSIDPELTRPKNKFGKAKPLGVWSYEGEYSRFKTLGAKRYLTEKDGKLQLTVSGLAKQTAVDYLLETYGSNDAVFAAFDDQLYIPPGRTGKLTHTYIDEEISGSVTDYTGRVGQYHELSCVHLSPADYSLSLSKLYIDYLRSIKE